MRRVRLMKKEMVKLNRVRIAHSEEEEKRLISEGYTPVDSELAASETNDSGQKADPPQAQDGNSQTADDGGKKAGKGAGKK